MNRQKMSGPFASLLGDGSRLHLQHGPIDLIIGAETPDPAGRHAAFKVAAQRFDTILQELVSELPLLRRAVNTKRPQGLVARRMHIAAQPFAAEVFVTPMAAVAGAVADEVLSAMVTATPISRAYVNNGGDIALHLAESQQYKAAIAGLDGAGHGRITIDAATDVRGIATSGQGGRSLSLGISKSVTVLAQSAAAADVAATLIANAVDVPGHPSIIRVPACDLDPDSDLGGRLVVTRVGHLADNDVDVALSAGADTARGMYSRGLILGAALFLGEDQRIVGELPHHPVSQPKRVIHA